MKFAVCTLLAVCLSSAAATSFKFNGAMKCDSPNIWCYTVEAKEIDLISNDYIAEHRQCVNPSKLLETSQTKLFQNGDSEFKMAGTMDDDGILDNYFEIAMHVSHNCTGTEQYIYDDYVEVPVTNDLFTMSRSYDLNKNTAML